MKLHKTRKEQGIEIANREHAKGAREWATGGAGRPGPVAILGGLFAQVQARYVLLQGSCLGDFSKFSGRPALFKPPDLLFSRNSSEFFLEC